MQRHAGRSPDRLPANTGIVFAVLRSPAMENIAPNRSALRGAGSGSKPAIHDTFPPPCVESGSVVDAAGPIPQDKADS
jgi:hypothetical protein